MNSVSLDTRQWKNHINTATAVKVNGETCTTSFVTDRSGHDSLYTFLKSSCIKHTAERRESRKRTQQIL